MVKWRNNGIGRVKWGGICMGRVKEGIEGRMTSTNEILKKVLCKSTTEEAL